MAGQQGAGILGTGAALDERLDQIANHAHRSHENRCQHHQHQAVTLSQQAVKRLAAESIPTQRQQHHAGHTAPHAFPAFAGTDRRRQLAFAETPAELAPGKIGANISHPHQHQHRQQKFNAQNTRLRNGQPGQPENNQPAQQAQQLGNTRPAHHANAQQRATGQHPERTGQRPQPRQALRQQAAPPGQPTGQQAQAGQRQSARLAQLVQAAPLPSGGANQHQRQQIERNRGLVKERGQQNSQQNNCRDNALLEHQTAFLGS